MKTVTKTIQTSAPFEVVMGALCQALQRVGGQLSRTSQDTVHIVNGNANVQFSFVANINADFTLRPVPGGYEITGYLNTSPSTIFWICLVVGFFFLWFLWIVCAFYFFIDPTQSYMAALDTMRL